VSDDIRDVRRKIRGIPTMYRGILMRSRNEARWAAFFDILGWPWAYEPFDLDGYIPDFALRFDAGDLLVEVKSSGTTDDPEITEARAKIDRSGWDGEIMVVGAIPFDLDDRAPQPLLGLMRSKDRGVWIWDEARAFWCLSCGRSSILNAAGSWHCRRCGDGEGNAHVGTIERLDEHWAEACNRVQWRPGT
jgi:hypothetical protein